MIAAAGGGGGAHGHTVSVASVWGEPTVVFGVGTKIIVAVGGGRALTVDDGQAVRAVSFLRSPGGALCVVAAGDGKRINVYDVSAVRTPLGAQGPAEVDAAGKEAVTPLYSFGPHTKRITQVVACDVSTILFADKFGEVYRLSLAWGTSGALTLAPGDSAVPCFMLQHFSVLSTLFLSANTSERRRLFSCDKDCHVRVSCYPDTFRIEQFLWTEAPQSVVTCLVEIPDPSGVNRHSYFVTGTYDGKVHLWAADNALESDSPAEPFTLLGSLFAEEKTDMNEERATAITATTTTTAVVSLVHVTSSSSSNALDMGMKKRHSHGVLIAYANSKDVALVPLVMSNDDSDGDANNGCTLSFSVSHATRTGLESHPLTMVGCDANSALVLQRSGRVELLNALETEGGMTVVSVGESPVAALQAAVGELVRESGGALLREMNLFSQWRYDAVDPRTRKAGKTRGGSDYDDNGNNSNDDENEDCGSRYVADQLTGGKRARAECGSEA